MRWKCRGLLDGHETFGEPFSRHDTRGVQDREKVEAWRRSLPKWLDNVMGEYLGVTYEYDAHGNLARRGEPGGLTWLYRWDAAGRLKKAQRYARPPAAHEFDHQVRTADEFQPATGSTLFLTPRSSLTPPSPSTEK